MSRKKSPAIDISNPTLIDVRLYRAVSKMDEPDKVLLLPSNEPSVTLQLPVKVLETDTMSTLKDVLEKVKMVDTTVSSSNYMQPSRSTTNPASCSPSVHRLHPSSGSNSPTLSPHTPSSQPSSPSNKRSHSPTTMQAESPLTKRVGSLASGISDSSSDQPSSPSNQHRAIGNKDTVIVNYAADEGNDDTSLTRTLTRSYSDQNIFSVEEEQAKQPQKRTKKREICFLARTKAYLQTKKNPPNVERLISAPVLVEKTSFRAELSNDGYALVPAHSSQLPNANPLATSEQTKMRRSQSLEGGLDISDNEDVCPIPLVEVSNADSATKSEYKRAFSTQPQQNTFKTPPDQVPCDVCDEDIKKVLFNPRSVEALLEVLHLPLTPTLVNCYDVNMEAPIHAILRRKKKGRFNLLVTLLSNSPADVNLPTQSTGHTPLHIAVMEEDEMCVKALLAFGANIYTTDLCHCTQLKINCTNPKLTSLLEELSAAQIKGDSSLTDIPDKVSETIMEYLQRKGERGLCDEMEEHINRTLSISSSFSGSGIDSIAIALQQKEIGKFKSTGGTLPYSLKKGGVKILCLDGGGMKGLAQIEVLSQLEEATGRKIPELFDWIVGTSTGAIIALGLVYAGMSLAELRRLYFNMKERIFGKGRHNSEALESILKETFKTVTMNEIKTPKVMIGAVNKETTNLHLQFFNNCMDDSYSNQPVWKVARYTSAAPMYFTEFENYVDGGVLANNPCEYALTTIQNFYREHKIRSPVSLMVSLGSGVYPALKLGNIDAQQFLYFGIHTFRLDILKDRAANLISLLSNALVESEAVAKNCKSRCEEQGIIFYRFSPKLAEVIAAGETDNERLVNMLIKTRLQLKEQGLQDLVNLILRDTNSTR